MGFAERLRKLSRVDEGVVFDFDCFWIEDCAICGMLLQIQMNWCNLQSTSAEFFQT